MKLILHIFAKDARRFWPEILISLAVTAAFVWIYPNQWLQATNYFGTTIAGGGGLFVGPDGLGILAICLTFLVPISWWLLIARVIHAESLVGDRQYWFTRPYEWKKLLAAKALFLICFLYLPIFIAHCLLLLQAGFAPISYVPGLLFNLALISGILVLPLFSTATVTSNFARMSLSVVAVIICIIGIAAFHLKFNHTNASSPVADRLSIPLLLCGCGGAIALQYARRKTWLSRLLLLTIPVAASIITSTLSSDAMIDHAYSRQEMPITLAFVQDANNPVTTFQTPDLKEVQLNIPLQVSGVADGYVVIPNNVRVSIEAANGLHWTSPWQAVYATEYSPGTQSSSITFSVSSALASQMQSKPVTLHLIFAFTQARAGKVTRVAMPLHDFSVTGFGVCTPQIGFDIGKRVTGIACRSALRQPTLTFVEAPWSNSPCSNVATSSNMGIQGAAWIGAFETDPAEFGISSVWTTPVDLSNTWKDRGGPGRQPQRRYLCPGTPITFTQYELVGRTQSEFTIQNFLFPKYPPQNTLFQ